MMAKTKGLWCTVLGLVAVVGAEKLLAVHQVFHQQDCESLNFATEARIYPENPNEMIVTKRGGAWKGNEKGPGGIVLFNIANPSRPTITQQWDTLDMVEGQDRYNNLLVVASIGRGGLYTFDLSYNLLQPLAYFDIPTANRALHVKLKDYSDHNHGLIAFLSQGWCLEETAKTDCSNVYVVNVTDAQNPSYIGSIATGSSQPEGLMIRGDYLYVGGINSTLFTVVDIKDPRNPRVVKTMRKPYYNQMVSDLLHTGDDGSVNPLHDHNDLALYNSFVASLWGNPGGIAVFRHSLESILGSHQEVAQEIEHLVNKDLSKANRVHMHRGYAILPLEENPIGGFGIVRVDASQSNQNHSAQKTKLEYMGRHLLEPHTSNQTGINTMVYCLVAKDDTVIVLAAATCEIYSFQVPLLQTDVTARLEE